MIKLKIYNLLKRFSPEEIKEFKKYASSRLFNPRDYSPFIDAMMHCEKNVTKLTTNTEYLNMLADRMKATVKSVENRLLELYKVLESYLAFRSLAGNHFNKGLILLEKYIKYESFDAFDFLFKRLEGHILSNKYGISTLENLSGLYKIKAEKCFLVKDFLSYTDFDKKRIDYKIADFEIDFLRSKIELSVQKVYKSKVSDPYSVLKMGFRHDKSAARFKESDKKTFALLNLFHCAYLVFLDNNDRKSFDKLKSVHKASIDFFDNELNLMIYQMRMNSCIIRANDYKPEYYREMFLVIKEKLEMNLYRELTIENYPLNQFRDYVIAGLRVKEYKWVEDFIDKYSQYLPEKGRDNQVNLSKGICLARQGKFIDSLKYFDKVKKDNFIMYLDTESNRAVSFYFLGEYEEAKDCITLLLKYVKYHKNIPKVHVKPPLKRVTDISMLIKLRTGQIDKYEFELYLKKDTSNFTPAWVFDELKKIK